MKERTNKSEQLRHRSIVLYDGVCALCNWFVRFIVDRDPDRRFVFAPLQSDVGRKLLADHHAVVASLDTVILVKGERVVGRSEAAFQILAGLQTAWRLLLVFRPLPRRFTDAVYDIVARSRYRVFGRYDACPIPAADQRSRFLDGAFPSSSPKQN